MLDTVKKELTTIVGLDRATDKPEHLVAYSYDGYTEDRPPEIVLFPVTTEEVSAIMKVAYRENIPVTPRGAGTNVAGESLPLHGGIVVCLTKMDKILSVDAGSLTATVQPGAINLDLQKAVEKFGLMYPPDPDTWAVATLGGNVATNAGGPRTLKYGVTKDYLLGLTVVLADGDVLKTGGRTLKNVTGYNLTSLFCGSEGTLGIITEIVVRLIPRPLSSRTVRAEFSELEACSDAVAAIMAGGIIPAAMELMDRFVVNAVERSFKLGLPTEAEAMLLIQVDGGPETLEREVAHIVGVLKDKRAANIIVAENAAQAEQLWLARRSAGPAMFRVRSSVVTEDVTVPVSRLTTMIKKVVEICKRNRVSVGVLAHAGDGNLHPVVVYDRRDQDEYSRVQAAFAEMVGEALALGGTLSGEHGIGILKAQFMPLEMDHVAMRAMRKVKECFDPKGILNPGKFV